MLKKVITLILSCMLLFSGVMPIVSAEDYIANDNFMNLPDGQHMLWNETITVSGGGMHVATGTTQFKYTQGEMNRQLPNVTGFVQGSVRLKVSGYKDTHKILLQDRLTVLGEIGFHVGNKELVLKDGTEGEVTKIKMPSSISVNQWFDLGFVFDTQRGMYSAWVGSEMPETMRFSRFAQIPENGVNRMVFRCAEGVEGDFGYYIGSFQLKTLPYPTEQEMLIMSEEKSGIATVAGTPYETAVNVLFGLGFFEDTSFYPEDAMTRGEFIYAVRRLIEKPEFSPGAVSDFFTDVTVADYFSETLTDAYYWGLISGGAFRPNDPIKETEALKILTCLLGYGDYIGLLGGYPGGVLKAAKEAGLRSTNTGDVLNKGESANLIYRAVLCNPVLAAGIDGDDVVHYAKDSKTLLKQKMDITEVKGVISANNMSSLTEKEGNAKRYVTLNDERYAIGDSSAGELLGYSVLCYVEDIQGVKHIVYCMADPKSNEVYTVAAVDLAETDRTHVSYFENEKKVSAEISPVADLIYNGKRASYTSGLFDIEDGELVLIDHDDDKKADVVIIRDYITVALAHASASQNLLVGQDGSSYSLNEDNYEIILDGKSISVNELREWDVVTVMRSDDKEYFSGIVSRSSISGVVEELYASERQIQIDGQQYELIPSFAEALKPGMLITACLDHFGRVAALRENNISSGYGYLFSAGEASGLADWLEIRMICEDGLFHDFKTADNCRINGLSRVDGKKLDGKMMYTMLSGGDSAALRQLIRYNTNSDGDISDIYTAANDDIIVGGEDEELFSKGKTIANGVYRTQNKSFSDSIFLNEDTTLFIINGNAESMSSYSVEHSKNLFSDRSITGSMIGYDMDDFLTAGAILVINENRKNGDTVPSSSKSFIVKSLNTGVDYDWLTGYLNGEQVRIRVEQDDPTVYENGKSVLSLGDYIQVLEGGADQTLRDWYSLFDVDKIKLTGEKQYSNARSYVMRDCFYGDLKKVDFNQKKLLVTDNGGDKVYLFNDANITIYDMETDRISKDTISGLEVNDYIVFRIDRCVAYDIMVIRNIQKK